MGDRKYIKSLLLLIIIHLFHSIAPTIAINSTFAFDTPTDETGNNLTTPTTIQFVFTLPASLNRNGPIQRIRLISRVHRSITDILSSYFVSSMASFPNIPPYFALEVDIIEKRKRGLVKRQATVSL